MKKVAADLPYACVGGRTRGEQLVIRGDILQVFESISFHAHYCSCVPPVLLQQLW